MARVKVEVDLDEETLRWAEARAQRGGRSRDEVIEEALRRERQASRPLTEILRPVWERTDVNPDEAMAIADAGLAAVRAEDQGTAR